MDKNDKKILSQILNKEELESNLSIYANSMINLGYDYSIIRLSLNYFTMREIIEETAEDMDKTILEHIQIISELLRRNIISGEFNGDNHEKDIQIIHNIREVITDKMKILTAYTDTLQVYEHILNRVEFSVIDKQVDVDIDSLGTEVFQYVFNDKDKVVINSKIQLITSQLPVRMTKNKFYDILSASLGIYTGSDVVSVNDFIQMIRTTAMIELPEGYDTEYPNIYTLIQELKNIDYSSIDRAEFINIASRLEDMATYINDIVTNYLQLVEIVNDVYSILLAQPYYNSTKDSSEIARQIIAGVDSFFEKEDNKSVNVDDLLVDLEGKQEEIYEDFLMYEGLLFDIRMEHEAMIKALMLENQFSALYLIEKLLSSSLFIDLHEDKKVNAIADNSYIMCARDELIEDFGQLFKENSKLINRSIMAIVISVLPVFFNSQQEIKDYIDYSLSHCNNQGELMATASLLKDIMSQ